MTFKVVTVLLAKVREEMVTSAAGITSLVRERLVYKNRIHRDIITGPKLRVDAGSR